MQLEIEGIRKNYIHLTESTDETLTFEVKSESRNEIHNVYFDINNGWLCTCEQYYYRHKPCKHMRQAQEYYKRFYKLMATDFVYQQR